jgi:hypothetical protein
MQACAYVIGNGDRATRLASLAHDLDFRVVLPFNAVADAETRWNDPPVAFFLFAEVPRLAAHAEIIAAIRRSPVATLKFSPLIYFCRSPSMDDINACLGMGFDDIITEPHSSERVAGRLQRQIGAELTYFDTPGYFGPDRRRHQRIETGRVEPAGYRRVAIFRDLATGISVLGDGEQAIL